MPSQAQSSTIPPPMAAKTAITAPRSLGNRIGFWLGIVVFYLIYFIGNLSPDNVLVSRMAAVAALMAIWWISDAIPLAATSLLPLVLFPLSGIMKGKDVAPVYMNYIIFLFIGGFLIALAMERWNLHKRIALSIIRLAGSQPSRLVLGFMLATAFLSMWISNTATTIMMLAIGLAVIKQAEDSYGADKTKNLGVALLLGIAYSASIGGVSTLVGTPPNLALLRIFELSFPKSADAGYVISFGQFMLLGLPITLSMLAIIWFVLTRVCFRSTSDLKLAPEVIESEYRKLGKISYEENALDGVDIDWEFPKGDQEHADLNSFLQRLSEKLHTTNRILTIALGYTRSLSAEANACIDHVNLMSYQPWNPQPYEVWLEKAVTDFLESGLPPEKLILGLPFFTKELGGKRRAIQWTKLAGKGESTIPESDHEFSPVGKAACDLRLDLMKKYKLGGVMVWEFGQDSPNEKHSLMKHLSEKLATP